MIFGDIGFVPSAEMVIMVVGAGRGPLVRCSLSAASEANVPVRVYAVEKNPNAVITCVGAKCMALATQAPLSTRAIGDSVAA